jgi:hypothetical protein
VQSAIAYVGASAQNRSQPVVVVVISNAWIDPDGIGDFLDRQRAVERFIRDDETAVVYLEFTRAGVYRGLSYSFGPGNGCGFCASDAVSTVKLENGKLVGTLKGKEIERPFEVNIDVPIMSDDHGAPLPDDGGEPGKAYLAYHAALAKSDSEALRSTLSLRRVEVWNRANVAGLMNAYLGYLVSEHPQAVHVTRGWASATKASLVIEGIGENGPIQGEVLLLNENGLWHVEQEVFE